MKIPLFIPYVNRRDLLERAVRSAQCGGVEVNILDNSDGTAIGIPGHLSFIAVLPSRSISRRLKTGCSILRKAMPTTESSICACIAMLRLRATVYTVSS